MKPTPNEWLRKVFTVIFWYPAAIIDLIKQAFCEQIPAPIKQPFTS